MKPPALETILENLSSKRATDRRDALSDFKTTFNKPDYVNNFHIKNSKVDSKAWPNVFEKLFQGVRYERDECMKSTKTAGSSAAALRRLEDVASTVRWLTERTVHIITNRVTRPLFVHLLQTMVYRGKLLAPIALDYIKTLRLLVEHDQHLERVDDELWVRMMEIGFNSILDDPIGSRFEDEGADEADDSELFEDDQSSEDDVLPSTSRKRSRVESATQSQRASKRTRSTPQPSSVSREQVEFMSLVSILLGSSSSPILSPDYSYLPSSILMRLQRFLARYPGETSLLYDYLLALSSTLSQLSLNRTLDVAKFAAGSWGALLQMWETKQRRIKEGLVSIFRALLPFVTSENEMYRVTGVSFDRVVGLRKLSSALDGEADIRWGVDGLSLDSLRLESADVSSQLSIVAFTARTFRHGWNFDGNQALAWAVLELQADCIAKLFQLSESMHLPSTPQFAHAEDKRLRQGNPISSLLMSIQNRSSSNVRSYHLQTLLFVIDRYWLILHTELQDTVINTLLQFVSFDDGIVQSWVFLCFAAIASTIDSSSGISEGAWDTIWTNAIRRANVPAVSRAACHAACTILTHTRAHAQKDHRTQLTLASNRILSEIETLAKDLDVQGPPHPYDSVCAFLATCLKVASQDMHLYRMQLEEKVLSWLVECWQVAGFRDKALSLHMVKDLLILLESICGLSKPTHLTSRIPLPEGHIVDTLVNEAKTRVIKNYILGAQLPCFRTQDYTQGSSPLPATSTRDHSAQSLVQPRGRERRISTFLLKSLERLQVQWDEISGHPTAETARRSLDMAVMALTFESVLVLNGTRSDRRLILCACKLIDTVTALLPDARWTRSERALITLGLDSLTFFEKGSDDEIWNAMLPPDIGSGIKSQILHRLSNYDTVGNDALQHSRLNFLKAVWQNADIQSTFSGIAKTLRDVLRVALSTSPVHHGTAIDENDGFEPIRMATEQVKTEKNDSTSNRYTMNVCVSFLTVGPALQLNSGEATRDQDLVEFVLNYAKSRPEAFFSVLPTLIDKIQQKFLYLGLANLDSFITELGLLLQVYRYAKNNRLQALVIRFLASTLHIWASRDVAIGDTLSRIRELCHWLSKALKTGNIRSWEVRDLSARFISQYLVEDPSERAWQLEEVGEDQGQDWTPSSLLPSMGNDVDTRVRFRAAVITARLFAFARRTEPKQSISAVYLNVQSNLTNELKKYEHMLTRILSLGNIMVVASEPRRGAYWHLLETCLHTSRYSAHIEAVLRDVSRRLGLLQFSSLFENYASQLALSLRQQNDDFIRFPPHLLGYQDRKECASANFRSFAPTNIWNGGRSTFENHCRIVSLSVHEGFRSCFGDIIGYQIVAWIDNNKPTDGPPIRLLELEDGALLHFLKSHTLPDEDFDRCLEQNVDGVVVAVLRSLGDVEIGDIVNALIQDNQNGSSAKVFSDLVRLRKSNVEVHQPHLPAFPTETILLALHWLRAQAASIDEKATSYHVVHQLLAGIDRSPLVNEQLRLINSLCLWISTHPRDFYDPTLLHTLIHGTTALLGQSDLARSAQSILDWAFERYRRAKTKHPHIPDILVRIACTSYDFSRTDSDSALASLGTELLQWIDCQTFELSQVSSLSGQVMKALPAWPHQPSSLLAPLFPSITGEHLSSVLGDYRISSSKFRLVRRLREHALSDELDTDHFAKVDFWRLKECIPPSEQLQDADVDAFAALLYLNKGHLGNSRGDLSGSILGRHRRKVYNNRLALPQEPIILMLLAMLQRDLPTQSNAAYETLRLIKSVETERPYDGQLPPSEHQTELEYLGRFWRSPLGQTSRNINDLIARPSYLDSVHNFSRWVADVATLFSDILSSSDIFYAQMIPMLQSDTEFAEQILPILIHIILATEKDQHDASHLQNRHIISNFFISVLSSQSASVQCLRCVIDVVLHLRHFDREPPPPKSSKSALATPDAAKAKSYDALSYNKWLTIDFTLLARCSITCGAYTTALLFLELAAEEDVGRSDNSNDILYEIYRHIDEPDGFYGIQDADLHQNLIKRFHHENQWERAFRFHGASLEAGDMAGHPEGLVKSFHSFGFDHLANNTLRAGFASRDVQNGSTPHDISYRLAWRTETWDLPESVGHSSGASLYLALRAIHRERDDRTIDRIIRRCRVDEMDRLRTLGSENFAEIRVVVQDIMCLHEVANWRTGLAQRSLATVDLDLKWDAFVNIDSDFEFPSLENILATRISLVRSVRQKEERQRIGTLVTPFHQSLLDAETRCLVRLSEAARSANEVQIALNSIVRAVQLEKPPSLDAFEEFASVLWCQKEEKVAVEYLDRLPNAGWDMYIRDVVGNGKKALILAQLGSWSSAACLKKPEDIQADYFLAATKLIVDSPDSAYANVYHQYAIFAERQYYDIVRSPDAIRWKIYVDRKRQEIETRNKEIQHLPHKDSRRNTLEYHQSRAMKVLEADAESFRKHNTTRDGFLEQAIDMYSRCLAISDVYDQDAPIRLCSLWFANFEDERDSLQMTVANALQRIPSRKLVFLSHQLSARISNSSTGPLKKAQSSLQGLVLRMCTEHPFHILYQVYCLQPEDGSSRRQSRQQSSPVHVERAAAANSIFNRLRSNPTSKQRLQDVELLCAACLEWAKYPMPKNEKKLALPKEYKLSKITNLRVPVITHHTAVDPTMKYADCPWIDHFDPVWTNAGGINTPKIGFCVGTDGVKYKQLFKGQGNDDLRQDAVMEQVFDLVNGILRRDRETRRRLLNVRDYKVIPLAPQAGLLEFVGNTLPIGIWLNEAHQRYHPSEKHSSRVAKELGMVRLHKDDKRPPRTKEQIRDDLIKYWTQVVEKEVKPVMRHFFTEKHKTPNSWFAMRLDYSRSVATSSIVGHILGLGDRHISNILIDTVSGQVVPIDLGIAFDQGKLLGVPELVPFRLTRDMVDGMGMSGTSGVFQRCAEETLRVLRDGSEVIMTVLEVFKHDPLHSWTASDMKIQRVQGGALAATTSTVRVGVDIGIDMSSGSAEEAADRALSSVSRKLDKSLSVQTVVSQLVREATDPVNLAQMFSGWSGYY